MFKNFFSFLLFTLLLNKLEPFPPEGHIEKYLNQKDDSCMHRQTL
jgi:hypothetical protein